MCLRTYISVTDICKAWSAQKNAHIVNHCGCVLKQSRLSQTGTSESWADCTPKAFLKWVTSLQKSFCTRLQRNWNRGEMDAWEGRCYRDLIRHREKVKERGKQDWREGIMSVEIIEQEGPCCLLMKHIWLLLLWIVDRSGRVELWVIWTLR